MHKFLWTHLQELSSNSSRATPHFLPSRNWLCQLPSSYVTFIWWVLQRLSQKTLCKRITLRKSPPVPYVSEIDNVQETVSALKNDQSLKASIGKDANLHLPIWHCRMCKAFFVHMGLTLNTIKKQGHFKVYAEAHELYVEQRNLLNRQKPSGWAWPSH